MVTGHLRCGKGPDWVPAQRQPPEPGCPHRSKQDHNNNGNDFAGRYWWCNTPECQSVRREKGKLGSNVSP